MKARAVRAATPDILLVEDDPSLSVKIRAVLIRLGFAVVEVASTAQEAISFASSLSPKLALVDARLAGPIGGKGVALVLRNNGIPVVILTGTPLERGRS